MSPSVKMANLAIASVLVIGSLLVAGSAHATAPGYNGRIVFATSDINSVNPDGTGLVNLTDLPGGSGDGYSPTVSGSGARIAYVDNSEIWIMNADGSDPLKLTDNAVVDEFPALSPDGTKIAFYRDVAGDRDIWIMDSDGTDQSLLLDGPQEDFRSAFSPDGLTLYAQTEIGGGRNIGKLPTGSGTQTTSTNLTGTVAPVENLFADASPDGSRVMFTRYSTPSANRDLYSMTTTGTGLTPVATSTEFGEADSSYSPDGLKIVYTRTDVITVERLMIIADADGGNPTVVPLPAEIGGPSSPRWAAGPAPVIPPPDPPGPPNPPSPDIEAPQTTITKKPGKKVRTRKATYRFTSSESGSTFACKVDRKKYRNCKPPLQLKQLKSGKHTFRVRATDDASNTDPTPAKHSFKVVKKKRR